MLIRVINYLQKKQNEKIAKLEEKVKILTRWAFGFDRTGAQEKIELLEKRLGELDYEERMNKLELRTSALIGWQNKHVTGHAPNVYDTEVKIDQPIGELQCPVENPRFGDDCLMLATFSGLCEAYRASFNDGMKKLSDMQKQIDELKSDRERDLAMMCEIGKDCRKLYDSLQRVNGVHDEI